MQNYWLDKRLKGVIVFQVDVQSLPPSRADAFVERMKGRMDNEKLAGWGLIFTPVRHSGSRVYIYSMTSEGFEEIKPTLLQHQHFMDIHDEETEETVRNWVLMRLGAPVQELDEEIHSAVDYYVGRAFEFDMNDKKRYVLEEVQNIEEGDYESERD
jgi:hypothetical protein